MGRADRSTRLKSEEAGRRDPNDCERNIVEGDHLPDNGHVTAKSTLPKAVADDGDSLGIAQPIILGRNRSSEQRGHGEHGKEIAGHGWARTNSVSASPPLGTTNRSFCPTPPAANNPARLCPLCRS